MSLLFKILLTLVVGLIALIVLLRMLTKSVTAVTTTLAALTQPPLAWLSRTHRRLRPRAPSAATAAWQSLDARMALLPSTLRPQSTARLRHAHRTLHELLATMRTTTPSPEALHAFVQTCALAQRAVDALLDDHSHQANQALEASLQALTYQLPKPGDRAYVPSRP